MPSARTRSRGSFLNCRFAVNGIQKASRLFAVNPCGAIFSADESARAIGGHSLGPSSTIRVARQAGRLPRRANSVRRTRRDFLTIWSRESVDKFKSPLKGHGAAENAAAGMETATDAPS